MEVHLVDGTYELFRHYYALPSARDADGREVAAVRGVLASMLGMIDGRRDARRRRDRPRHRVVPQRAVARLQDQRGHRARPARAVPAARRGARRAGRRRLADGGVRGRRCAGGGARRRPRGPARRARGHLHARQGPGAVRARHARRAAEPPDARDPGRSRRDREVRRAAGVDSRLPRARRRRGRRLSRAAGLGREVGGGGARAFGHLESIPDDWREWHVNAASAGARWRDARRERERALLFRTLATLRTDIPLFESVDELQWKGPTPAFEPLAARLDAAVKQEITKSGDNRRSRR